MLNIISLCIIFPLSLTLFFAHKTGTSVHTYNSHSSQFPLGLGVLVFSRKTGESEEQELWDTPIPQAFHSHMYSCSSLLNVNAYLYF